MEQWGLRCLASGLAALAVHAGALAQKPQINPPAGHAISIDVLSASYGLRQSTFACSALEAVKRLCQGQGRCEIPVSNTVCDAGQRPPSVLIATLSVQYRCFATDTVRVQRQDRPFAMSLSCAGLPR